MNSQRSDPGGDRLPGARAIPVAPLMVPTDLERPNLVRELEKRVRELRALFQVAKLLRDERLPIDHLLREVANCLPGAMRYPEIAIATVSYGSFKSSETPTTRCRFALQFATSDGTGGEIGIAYQPEPLDTDDPFLAEERSLIISIADLLLSHFEQRGAREALVESEARLRIILESEPECVKIVSADGRLLEMNPAGLRLIEVEGLADVVGQSVFEMVHPDDRAAFIALHNRSLKGEKGELQFRIIGCKGSERWMETRSAPLRESDGSVSAVLSFTRDITERKRANEALQQSERRFASIFRASPSPIAITRIKDGQLIEVNDRYCELLGYERHELVGRSVVELNLWENPADRAPIIRQLLAEGSVPGVNTRFRRKSGELRDVVISLERIELPGEAEPVLIAQFDDVTPRNRAEEQIRQTSALLKAVADGTTDAVFVKDLEGRYLLFNEGAARLVGLPVDQVLGRDDRAIFGSEDAQFVMDRDRQVMESGETQTAEEVLTAAGVTRTYLATKAPYRDQDGQVIGVVGISRDITERKKHEQLLGLLSSLGQRLNATASPKEAGETILNVADELFGWNAATLDLYSGEKHEISSVLSVDTVNGRRQECPPAYDQEAPSPMAWRVLTEGPQLILRKNPGAETTSRMFGDLRRPSASLMLVPIRHGARRIGLLSIQSYRLEAYTRKDLDVLQLLADHCGGALNRMQDEENLREQAALLDKAHDAISVQDMDDRIIFWNKGAERTYGWSAAEALGRKSSELVYRDPSPYREAHAEMLAQGEWEGEMTHRTRDGHEITVEARWTLVRDSQGRPKSVLAINTDVTEKKKLEVQFLRAQRMESIGTLAGGIAHDLNNVFAPILMSIDLLKMNVPESELDTLNALHTAALRGSELVRQVLSFGRGVPGQRVTVDVRQLIREVSNIIRDTFPKSVVFEVVAKEELWAVVGDPTQLHQVVLNLCVNARDAMPNGGRLTIQLENVLLDHPIQALPAETKPGRYLMIEVSDTGQGIPSEIQDKIFEPFFTTKEIGKGTGLGLSTTLAIVKSHGGFITVQSQPGAGSRFRVFLPANTGPAASEDAARQDEECQRGKGELILVVDDEESIRQVAQATLERFNYRVLVAANGAEAINVYAHRGPEIALVLTDMAMPVMDGPALVVALRTVNPQVKIIASSGLSSRGSLEKAKAAGIREFLPKPYPSDVLLRTVRHVLDQSEIY